jgi:hypothetical protein
VTDYPANQILILVLGVGVLFAVARLCIKVDDERNACLVLVLAGLLCVVSLGATVEGEYHLIASLMEGQPDRDAADPGKPVFVGSLKPIDGQYYPPLKPTNAMFSQPSKGGGR